MKCLWLRGLNLFTAPNLSDILMRNHLFLFLLISFHQHRMDSNRLIALLIQICYLNIFQTQGMMRIGLMNLRLSVCLVKLGMLIQVI
jgi:hypothetical protein